MSVKTYSSGYEARQTLCAAWGGGKFEVKSRLCHAPSVTLDRSHILKVSDVHSQLHVDIPKPQGVL